MLGLFGAGNGTRHTDGNILYYDFTMEIEIRSFAISCKIWLKHEERRQKNKSFVVTSNYQNYQFAFLLSSAFWNLTMKLSHFFFVIRYNSSLTLTRNKTVSDTQRTHNGIICVFILNQSIQQIWLFVIGRFVSLLSKLVNRPNYSIASDSLFLCQNNK